MKQQAASLKTSLRATLIIWGTVAEQSNGTMIMIIDLLGTELDLKFTWTIASLDSVSVPFLEFWALTAAAFSFKADGAYDRAREMFILARGP